MVGVGLGCFLKDSFPRAGSTASPFPSQFALSVRFHLNRNPRTVYVLSPAPCVRQLRRPVSQPPPRVLVLGRRQWVDQLCQYHVPMIYLLEAVALGPSQRNSRFARQNSSTGVAEIGFAGTAGLTIRSPRSNHWRLRLSGCTESISSPALSLDSRLLRCLVVRGSALVGMGDGAVIISASLLGMAVVGAVPWVCRPDVWTVSSVSITAERSISATADVTALSGSL